MSDIEIRLYYSGATDPEVTLESSYEDAARMNTRTLVNKCSMALEPHIENREMKIELSEPYREPLVKNWYPMADDKDVQTRGLEMQLRDLFEIWRSNSGGKQ